MQIKKQNKKAFTLIELLIVIAIIGILFIVLVSKVDFATDKAKASGVQTDFRSFQMAFEHVAKENAGFTTFGWDQGDLDYDGVRDSRDEMDTDKDGTQNGSELDFTGRKVYIEDFTGIYSLRKSTKNADGDVVLGTAYDSEALARLETAINANLDPKLHITIDENGLITMANGAQDPWKTEYQGYLLTTDTKDDRGAIVLYSLGANAELGSVANLDKGVVTVTIKTVPATMNKNGYGVVTTDNNKAGKDDYSLATVYTYKNGYGEVITTTTGFSNNQTTNEVVSLSGTGKEYQMLNGTNQTIDTYQELTFRSEADFDKFDSVTVDGNLVDSSNYTVTEGSTIVVLKESYVRTLADGNHIISIVSNDGYANTMFTLNCIENNVGEKTNVSIQMSYVETDVVTVASTTATNLYDLVDELISENKLGYMYGMNEYFIWDDDVFLCYVGSDDKYHDMHDVAVTSNTTYTFYLSQFGKQFHDAAEGDSLWNYIYNTEYMATANYKTIWVDYGMIVGGGSVVCPVFAGVNDTYLDILYHAPFRWYQPEPDPRVPANAESTIVSNKLWILHPGYESFGTLQDYFICGIMKGNDFQDLYTKTSNGEYVYIYAMVRDGETYTSGQVVVEMMELLDDFSNSVNSLRYNTAYSNGDFSVTVYNDGSCQVSVEGETETIPSGVIVIFDNDIYIEGELAGKVADDGSYIVLYDTGDEGDLILYAN